MHFDLYADMHAYMEHVAWCRSREQKVCSVSRMVRELLVALVGSMTPVHFDIDEVILAKSNSDFAEFQLHCTVHVAAR